MKFKIRFGTLGDLSKIQELFTETITFVCNKDYNEQQLNVWKSSVENTKRWWDLILNQYFIIAVIENRIIGFASLDKENHIDVIFVHKDFQRKGIAQQLFNNLEQKAKKTNTQTLTSDVSKTAKPFFESNGFKTLIVQTQVKNGIKILNYKMQKKLSYE